MFPLILSQNTCYRYKKYNLSFSIWDAQDKDSMKTNTQFYVLETMKYRRKKINKIFLLKNKYLFK